MNLRMYAEFLERKLMGQNGIFRIRITNILVNHYSIQCTKSGVAQCNILNSINGGPT